MALGYNRPDDIPITLSTVMQNIIDDKSFDVSQGIIHHSEGVDLLLLASGENNHSRSIENNQFQSNKNNQSKIRKRSQPSLGM